MNHRWLLCACLLIDILVLSGGFITKAPQRRVVSIGSNVSFSCNATIGRIIWEINHLQIIGRVQQGIFNDFNIFSPLPTVEYSVVNVTNATYIHNNSTFECVVEDFRNNAPIILERSDPVKLLVYGEPSPPSNLNLTFPIQGSGVHLSWTPGSSLEGEEVIFVITSFDLALGTSSEFYVNASSVYPVLPPPQGRSCQHFRFTVHSENGFGRSSTGENAETIIPRAPYALEGNEINVAVSLQRELATAISFDAPSPCQEYNVEEYIFIFTEVASSNAEMELSTPFNVSHHTASLNVALVLTSSDGVQTGKQYNATIIAINMAGFSHSTFTFYTTDLQSSIVVLDPSTLTVNATCIFASGASAMGCLIYFGNLLQVNVIRQNGSSIAMKTVHLPLVPTNETVTVAELMSDGTVSLIIQPVAVQQISTPEYTTPGQETPNITSSSNSILQENILLFIIIGGIIGTIPIL